jgi:hypothetical protein
MARPTLAVVVEQIRQMKEGQDRILHVVEGNGKPGLIDRVAEVEQAQEAQAKELTALTQSLTKLTEAVAAQTKALTELSSAHQQHVQPENLQHATIARAITSNPQGALKYLGWIIAALLFLLSNGEIAQSIGKWLMGAP